MLALFLARPLAGPYSPRFSEISCRWVSNGCQSVRSHLLADRTVALRQVAEAACGRPRFGYAVTGPQLPEQQLADISQKPEAGTADPFGLASSAVALGAFFPSSTPCS